MEPSTSLQNIKWKYSEIKEWQSVEVPTAKLQEFFGPIILKNIEISNAHNFRNTDPISKIPTLLSSEAWDLSPYKISWILVRVRWKIPILLDHLTWNDPPAKLILGCFRTSCNALSDLNFIPLPNRKELYILLFFYKIKLVLPLLSSSFLQLTLREILVYSLPAL